MDLILTVLCMILCNKVPKNIVSFRPDSLQSKIKLMVAPRGVEPYSRTVKEKDGTEVAVEKNTNEKALVRIMVPKRTMTLSEYNAEQKAEEAESPEKAKEGEEGQDKSGEASRAISPDEGEKDQSRASPQPASRLSRVPSERIIETDQDEKALAIANKINLTTPYMVLTINQYAAKAHRHDFIEQIKSKVFDFFNENSKVQKQLQELADEEAEAVEQAYIKANCNEYDLPCLDYLINAPDFE